MKRKLVHTRRIAPRLANGESRENFGSRLPPAIKAGLRMIAARENKSMSWVMEDTIIKYFHLRRPEYVPPKKPTTEERSEARGTLREPIEFKRRAKG